MAENGLNQPESLKGEIEGITSVARYRRLTVAFGLGIALVSVIPLLVVTSINYWLFRGALHAEHRRPILQLTDHAQQSLEFFLKERLSTLVLVARQNSISELSDQDQLSRLLSDLKQTFGGFSDLRLIDPAGETISCVGPYPMLGSSCVDQEWFRQAHLHEKYISDVFLGHLGFPHFVVAVRLEDPDHQPYILRATISTERMLERIPRLDGQPNSDVFLVNGDGVLQTPSRFYGPVLDTCPLKVPLHTKQAAVMELEDAGGHQLVVGHAGLESSQFTLLFVDRPYELESWLSLHRDLVLFTGLSTAVILLLVLGGTRVIVKHLRGADRARVAVFHNLEYTNKMAAIGRLSAGVAHEINNPLAIIEENAGLLKDLLTLSDEPLPNSKVLERVESILRSVGRCSAITHRLLGFAKHMDVQRDRVNLEVLVREVLGFLDKEASHRDLSVTVDAPDDLPEIETGRGQLQQVFLNIINNAFAAVKDGGKIHISMDHDERLDQVTIHLIDDGVGIPPEHLKHVFEPFFTTKGGSGTGLGLSITYGIIEKLGGKISVTSTVGQGTCFIIDLPLRRP